MTMVKTTYIQSQKYTQNIHPKTQKYFLLSRPYPVCFS